MTMPEDLVPPGSWDCHVHLFDPDRFSFCPKRAYTPLPASLETLMAWSPVDNLVIVQATVESHQDGVLAHLAEARQRWLSRNFYATVVSTLDSDGHAFTTSQEVVDNLHAAGVRCVRVHGGINTVGVDIEGLRDHLIQVASSPGVAKHEWTISMQLPLVTWAALRDWLLKPGTIDAVTIIADHLGCATPADAATPECEAFLDMLRKGRIYVKISALHRRSPKDIHALKKIVQLFADAGPDRLLWGSDWPHVNSGVKGLVPTPHLQIDALEELRAIKTWLTQDQWRKMMVENPQRVFAAR